MSGLAGAANDVLGLQRLALRSVRSAGAGDAFVFTLFEKLLMSAEDLRQVAAVAIAQAPMPGALRNDAKLLRNPAMAITTSAIALLANAKRIEKLGATAHSLDAAHGVRRIDAPDVFHQSVANVLVAAFVKTKGGKTAQSSDWEPALHAAATAVDALADYVIARVMSELRSECSESGTFVVAAARHGGIRAPQPFATTAPIGATTSVAMGTRSLFNAQGCLQPR